MTENNYRVVMTGELAGGHTREEVTDRLCKLFKTKPEKTSRLLKSNPVVVKKNADLETARKYVRAITSAGAECRIDPPPQNTPAPQPPPEACDEPSAAGAPQENAEPQIVPVNLNNKPEERFSPRVPEKITASRNGLDFNIPEFSDIPYEQLAAITAYAHDERDYLLVFTKGTNRPFCCAIDNIRYPDFPIKALPKTIASFRNFLFFLCRQNPGLVIEETTFDFLSGNTLQTLNSTQPEKLATSMGKLLASGDIAAQT